MPRILRVLLLVPLVWAAAPRAADACTCVAGIPICETVWKTPVIFSGEVLEISDAPSSGSGEPIIPLGRSRLIRFRVDQVWRGDVSGEVLVRTGRGGGDCGYNFSRGMAYVVYAHAAGAGLSTSICTRTRPMSAAADDLEYFKIAFTPRALGEVFGRAVYRRTSPDGHDKPIAGYSVTLSSAQKNSKATTDADGRYSFKDVPAGKVTVKLGVPDTEHAYGGGEIELPDTRGCATADFYVVADGRVSAHVVDTSGRPVQGVELELVQVDSLTTQGRYPSTNYTESTAAGQAEWKQVAAGRYVVGVNITRGADPKQPFATVFFPGVTELAKARTIDLTSGQRVDLGTFKLPARLTPRAITGVVLLPDGTPAAKATVLLRSIGGSRETAVGNATAGEDGRFTIPAYLGQRYRLSAFSTFVPGQPQLQMRSLDFELTMETEPIILTVQGTAKEH